MSFCDVLNLSSNKELKNHASDRRLLSDVKRHTRDETLTPMFTTKLGSKYRAMIFVDYGSISFLRTLLLLFVGLPSFVAAQSLNLGPDLILCNGNGPTTITANASGAGTGNISSYVWSINGTTLTNSTSTLSVSPAVTPTNLQVVVCTATLANNTVLTDTVEVLTINPVVTPNQCIANGATANMSVTFNPALPGNLSATYGWSGPSTYSANTATATVSAFGSSKAGTYSVVVNIMSGSNTVCSSTLSTQLNLIPNTPTFTIPSNGCQGVAFSPSNFTPQPGVSYAWTVTPSNGNSTGLNSANPTFILNNGGNNSISVTATSNAGGCTATSASANISLPNFTLSAPSIEVGGDYFNVMPNNPNIIPVCLGVSNSAVTIENNNAPPLGNNPNAVTYTYSLNGSAPAPFPSTVTGNVVYGNNPLVITATFQGCTQTLNANVYLGSNPFVSLGTSNSIGICPGTSLPFTINPTPPNGQMNPPGTTYTVTYSDTPGVTDNFTDLPGATTVNHVYNTTSCGMSYSGGFYPTNTFYTQVTAENFCGQTSSTVSPITVNDFPVANFTVSDSTVCVGQSVTVTNTGTAGSVIGNSPPYNCTGQGKFYWTITGGVQDVDYTLSGTLGFFNTNYGSTASNGSNTLVLTFLNSGYYTITQHYYNLCGIKTKVRNICVIDPPVSAFTMNANATCSPVTVNFVNNTVPPPCNGTPVPMGYTWTVSTPGGTSASYTTSTLETPPTLTLTNNTSSPQNFTITLVASPKDPYNPSQNFGNPNCSTTSVQTVTVNPKPIYSPTNITTCDNPYVLNLNLQTNTNIPISTFTWSAAANNNVTGETTTTQTTSTISNNLNNTSGTAQTVTYTVTPTSNLGCVGDPTPFTVTLNVINAGTISSNQAICSGTAPNTLTGTVPSGSGTLSYQWQQSTDNINWSNIPGATDATYSPPSLSATRYYRRVVSYIVNGVTCAANSNVVTISVNVINAGTLGTNQNICSGTTPNVLNFVNAASGSGTLTYQWQSGTSISGPWTNIPGQVNATYAPPALSNTTHYTAVVTSLLNGVSCSTTASPVTISVFDLTPGSIAANQTICVGGDPNPLSSVSNAISSGTSISYQWQQSSDNINWSNIPGATSNTYDPPVLSATTYYRRTAIASVGGNTVCQNYSNAITITVVNDPAVTAPQSQTICAGGAAQPLVVSPSGGISTNYSYQWYNSSGIIAGQTNPSYTPPSVNGTYYCIVSIAPASTGCQVTSATASINIVPGPVVTSPQSASYCFGTASANPLTVSASGGLGSSYEYQWFSNTTNSNSGGTPISAANGGTNSSFTPPIGTVGTIYYYCQVNMAGASTSDCSAVSAVAMIEVLPTPTINPISNLTICGGQTSSSINFNGTATGYNWTNNNTNTGIANQANNVTAFAPFTASNPGLTAINSQITVTPEVSSNGTTCVGSSTSFQVVVQPTPTVNPVSNQVICVGENTSAVNFTGNLPSTTYNWVNSNTSLGLNAATGTNQVPSFTGVNAGNNSASTVITVTPNTAFCSGTPIDFSVTVNPLPLITNTQLTQTICPGASSAVNWTSNLASSLAINYTWQVVTAGSNLGGYLQNGTGNLPAMVFTNSGNSSQSVLYEVTPSFGNCVGSPVQYTIVVNPGPTMNPISPQEICSGSSFTTTQFSSSVQGINYTWQLTSTNIPTSVTGYPGPSGTGNITGAPIMNSGTQAFTLTYAVTPNIQGLCSGSQQVFNLTILPVPEINFDLANQTICSGGTGTPINLSSPTPNLNFTWSVNAPLSISGANPSTGASGQVPQFTLTNLSNNPQIVEIVASASTQGTACPGMNSTATITVLPVPVVNPVSNVAVCAGAGSSNIQFSGTATAYNWSNDNTSTGIAASANNVQQFSAFNAINTTSAVLSSMISVSPIYAMNGISCPGNSVEFLVHVNPAVQMNAVSPVEICHGTNVASTVFSTSNTLGTTTYTWINSNTQIGLGASGNGNLPAFSAQNTGNLPITATITVTPTLNLNGISCVGSTQTFTITVNPTPSITTAPMQQTLCPGVTTQVDWSSNLGGGLLANYTWNLLNTGPNISGALPGGNGSLPSMTLGNNGNATQQVVYTVTPSYLGCNGSPVNYTIHVNPGPNMSPVATQEICSGTSFSTTQFNSTIQGISYSWQLTNTNLPSTLIGYPQPNGNGNISGTTIVNTSPSAITLNYQVTPSANGCSGIPQQFLLTIQPELQVFFSLPSQTICDGSVSEIVNLTSNAANAVINWSVGTIPAGVTGFNVLSGTTSIPAYNLNNSTNIGLETQFTVQAVNSINNALCPGNVYNYSITVIPGPTIDGVSNQLVCNGAGTAPITFNGTGTSYLWTNNLPNIGTAASGVNTIPSFTAINTQATTLVATITATPTFVLNGVNCVGAPTSFNITVNPSGQINPLQNITVCNQETVASVPFTSTNFGGTNSYSWTNSNTTTGLIAGGVTVFTPSFTGLNSGTTANTSMVTITPTFTNLGLSCPGPSTSFNITVNPTPAIFSTSDTIICNNTSLFLAPATNVPSIFAWQGTANPQVQGVTTNVQNGPGILDSLTNTSNTPQVVSYTITPISNPQGCYGTPSTILVTVQPEITIASQTSFEVCSGTLFNAVLTSNIPATFSWFATANPNVSGASTAGNTGNIINDVLVNSSSTPQQVVYSVIPTSVVGNCSGSALVINVLVYPELVITSPNTHTICSQGQLNVLLTANTPGTFSWFAVPNGNVNGETTAIQNTNAIVDQLTNVSGTVQQVQYNVVLTANNQGCTSDNYPITVNIIPIPSIGSLTQTVACPNQNLQATTPNGVYTAFNWSNSNPANGLPASGTNATQIPAFTAQNTNNFPLTSQLQLTPIFTLNGLTCTGAPTNGQIVVNPNGQVNPLNNLEVCSGQTVSSVAFSTQNVLGNTTYTWTNNNLNTGLQLTSGSGSVPSFTATNSTNQTITSTISVIANFTNAGVSCPSQPQTYNITVNPIAQVNPIQNYSHCSGTAISPAAFTGLNATGFSWTNSTPAIGLGASGSGNIPTFTASNNTNNELIATINVTGIYNSSTLACPGASQNFTITVAPVVAVNPIPNQTVCHGENTQVVNFTSNVNNATFSWTNSNPAAGLAPLNGQNTLPSFSGLNNSNNQISTQISVTGSINSCPGSTQNFQIFVNPLPQITNAPNNQTVCTGQQSQVANWQHNVLTGGVASYTWNLQNNNPNISGALQNGVGSLPTMTLINSANTVQSISYEVTATVAGCTGPVFIYTILVNPTPQMNAPLAQSICSGAFFNGSVFSSSMPGINYEWSLSGAATIPTSVSGYPAPSGIGAIPGAFISNTGTDGYTLNYAVTPMLGSCAGSSQILQVTIVPNPTIVFNLPNQEICSNANTNTVLIGSPTNGAVITWQTTAPPTGLTGLNTLSGTSFIPQYNLSNALIQPQTLNFTVTAVVQPLGCSSQSNYSILVLPIPSTTAPNDVICSQETASIQLSSNQNVNFVWSGIPNPAIGGASVNNQTTSTVNDQLFNLTGFAQTQQYTAQSFLIPQGCPGGIATFSVVVQPLPQVAFDHSNPCVSDTIYFNNLSDQNNLYTWSFGDGTTSFQFSPWHYYSQNGQYTVTLQTTDGFTGCTAQTSQTFHVPAKPYFTVDTTQHCAYGQFTFTNQTPGVFSNVYWEFGDGQFSFDPLITNHVYTQSGCYDITLNLTAESGCQMSLTLENMVCILPNPVANFVVTESAQPYNNNLFTFENLSLNALTYLWTFGDGTQSFSIHPSHSYNAPAGIYPIMLVAMNEFGCADTTYSSIQLLEDLLIYVPNTFTPNNDGTNDIFLPILSEGVDIYTYRLLIFNRWGEVLFESLNKEVGWDGTYGGNVCQDGVYVWKITFNSINDEEEYEFIGHVNLLR